MSAFSWSESSFLVLLYFLWSWESFPKSFLLLRFLGIFGCYLEEFLPRSVTGIYSSASSSIELSSSFLWMFSSLLFLASPPSFCSSIFFLLDLFSSCEFLGVFFLFGELLLSNPFFSLWLMGWVPVSYFIIAVSFCLILMFLKFLHFVKIFIAWMYFMAVSSLRKYLFPHRESKFTFLPSPLYFLFTIFKISLIYSQLFTLSSLIPTIEWKIIHITSGDQKRTRTHYVFSFMGHF